MQEASDVANVLYAKLSIKICDIIGHSWNKEIGVKKINENITSHSHDLGTAEQQTNEPAESFTHPSNKNLPQRDNTRNLDSNSAVNQEISEFSLNYPQQTLENT